MMQHRMTCLPTAAMPKLQSSSLVLLLLLLQLLFEWNASFALQSPNSAVNAVSSPIPVLVSGASGKTGKLVFSLLLKDARFTPKALVRSPKSAKKLQKAVPNAGLDQIIICDVTKLATSDDAPGLPMVSGLEGCQAMVICTSAVPTISKISLIKAFLKIPWNLIRGKKAIDFRSFRFVWQNGQYPELVDYQGQVAVPWVVPIPTTF
jgi:hypothetical protein